MTLLDVRAIRSAIIALAGALSLASHSQALEIAGYVPYYRLGGTYNTNILPDQLSLLDEVRYFGLSVNSAGGIVPLSGSLNARLNDITTIKSIINSLPVDERPRLDITLGGAGVDSVFSSIAASSSLRTTLAQNIDDLLDTTGATSVDIDWEHPNAGVERSTLFPALLKRIKQEVGLSRRVSATAAPSVVISNSIFSGPDAIDAVSLMTYDLGWWGGDPSNPNNGEHSLHEYVEDTIDAWTDPASANSQRPWVWTNSSWGNDTPANKVGVGLPFYARDVFGGAVARTYGELLSGGTPIGGGYYSFGGSTYWIPDQTTIEDRIQLAHDEGLQSVFIWEMGQDIDSDNANSMLRIAANKRDSLIPDIPGDFDGNGVVDDADLTQWEGDFGVNADSDANDDGNSDGADLLIWQKNLGSTGSLGAASAAVPEPSSALLLCCGVFLLSRRSHRQGCWF